MATTPEGRIKKQIKDVLDKHGAWYFMPVSNGFGVHGIPDVVGAHKGRAFGVEAKAAGKKPTALQVRQRNLMVAAGAKWFLVDGLESLGEVDLWLRSSD